MFVRNFNMPLAASGTLEAGVNYQYLCNLVLREALCQFDLLFADVEGTETLKVDYIIRGLYQYPPCKVTVKKEARNAPWNE